MVDRDTFDEMLDELACELPQEFYRYLNGGIIVSDAVMMHPAGIGDDLYIMGQYSVDSQMGRQILIFYGSFMRVYGGVEPELLKAQMRATLRHEFTHHLESLAGEKGLEIKDQQQIAQYLAAKRSEQKK